MMKWTEEATAELKRLYDKGLGADTIAERLGVTARSIEAQIRKLGLTRWTDEAVAEAKRLYLQNGWSASLIAEHLGSGFTRHMVIGKLTRLGISQDRPGPKHRALVERRRDISFTVRNDKRIERVRQSYEARAEYEAREAKATKAHVDGIPFLERRLSQCAEILGSPNAETVICCGRPVERASYCKGHAAKNYARAGCSRVAA